MAAGDDVKISQGKTQLFHSGRPLTAKDLNMVGMNVIYQGADQPVTSSTTFVDSAITFTPDTGAVYYYELFIAYTAGATGDFKWRWNAQHALFCRSTLSAEAGTANTDAGQAEADQLTQPGAAMVFRRPANATEIGAGGMGVASALSAAYDRGTFATDGTSAAITLQFAQQTSHTTTMNLRANTTFLYQRIA